MQKLFAIATLFIVAATAHAQDVVYTRTYGPVSGRVLSIVSGDARVNLGHQTLTIRAADIDSITINETAQEDGRLFQRPALKKHSFVFGVGGSFSAGSIFIGGLDLKVGWKPTHLTTVGLGLIFGSVDTELYDCDCGYVYDYRPSYYDYDYNDFFIKQSSEDWAVWKRYSEAEYIYTTCAFYGYVRRDLIPRKVSPYFEFRAGVVPEGNVDDVALLMSGTLGVRAALRHVTLLYGMGFTFLNAHDPVFPNTHMDERGALCLNLAVEF